MNMPTKNWSDTDFDWDACHECGRTLTTDERGGGMKFTGDPSDPLDGAPDCGVCAECCKDFTPLTKSNYPYYFVDAAWLERYGTDLTDLAA